MRIALYIVVVVCALLSMDDVLGITARKRKKEEERSVIEVLGFQRSKKPSIILFCVSTAALVIMFSMEVLFS